MMCGGPAARAGPAVAAESSARKRTTAGAAAPLGDRVHVDTGRTTPILHAWPPLSSARTPHDTCPCDRPPVPQQWAARKLVMRPTIDLATGVAALGGFLVGYDTAVIAGAVGSL